ncbi:MAG: DNA-binding response regulator [Methylotenera sp.]|nr:DNA-binding response regulator [Methylotenera sp.]
MLLNSHLNAREYPIENPKVLLIDDSTVDLQLLISMMSSRNMRISVAFNGREGVEKAILQSPDLILLDVVMPKLDGYATCRMLKNQEATRYTPVIFLSAKSDLESRLEGLALGAVDFIGKPFSEEEVIAKVEVHLDMVRRMKAQIAEKSGDLATPIDSQDNHKDAALTRMSTQYLREHLRIPPSPEALAKLLGTNEKRLNQAFQASFGMPIFGWIREERLRLARELVTQTETSLLSIADHLGYGSAASFSTAFKERFGCSPRELRKQQQLKELSIDVVFD